MADNVIRFLSDDEWPQQGLGFELPISPSAAALLVIDLQHYCIDSPTSLAQMIRIHNARLFEEYRVRVLGVLERTQELLAAFRERNRPVVFTRHGSLLPDGSDLIERRRNREKRAVEATAGRAGHLPCAGTPEHSVHSSLAPRPGELVLDKNTSSAFHSTGIDLLLRNLGIHTLVVAGIATDMCVLTTALDASDRGFHVILAEDACTTIDPGAHDAVRLMFGRVWGYAASVKAINAWLAGGKLFQ